MSARATLKNLVSGLSESEAAEVFWALVPWVQSRRSEEARIAFQAEFHATLEAAVRSGIASGIENARKRLEAEPPKKHPPRRFRRCVRRSGSR